MKNHLVTFSMLCVLNYRKIPFHESMKLQKFRQIDACMIACVPITTFFIANYNLDFILSLTRKIFREIILQRIIHYGKIMISRKNCKNVLQDTVWKWISKRTHEICIKSTFFRQTNTPLEYQPCDFTEIRRDCIFAHFPTLCEMNGT